MWIHHRSKASHTLSTNYHPSGKAEKLAIISCPDLNSTGPYLQVIRCPACQFKVWPHEIIHISYCFCIGYIKYIYYQLDIAISSSVIIRKIYFTVILCIYIIVIYFYCTKWLFTNLFLFHFQTGLWYACICTFILVKRQLLIDMAFCTVNFSGD